MKLKKGVQYKIKWIDAFGSAAWTDKQELEKLITLYTPPTEQTLYFIKQTDDFYIFTSGRIKSVENDETYIDIHAVPKGWITKITQVR